MNTLFQANDQQKDFFFVPLCLVFDNREWSDMLYYHMDNPNEYVMLEGSQGCDLSLNFNVGSTS